ncbi:MAG: hypothetical protein U5M50_04085 [Sphingobium sp.]|nr:hypothetical protein [Sphingobium sp.]
MGGGRDIMAGERALALATKRAVQSAGGLDMCVGETRIGKAQLSRCSAPHEPDSISIRDAVTIDALAADEEGAPHIIGAMARQLGGTFVRWPDVAPSRDNLIRAARELAREHGDAVTCVLSCAEGNAAEAAQLTLAEKELQDLADAVMVCLSVVRGGSCRS